MSSLKFVPLTASVITAVLFAHNLKAFALVDFGDRFKSYSNILFQQFFSIQSYIVFDTWRSLSKQFLPFHCGALSHMIWKTRAASTRLWLYSTSHDHQAKLNTYSKNKDDYIVQQKKGQTFINNFCHFRRLVKHEHNDGATNGLTLSTVESEFYSSSYQASNIWRPRKIWLAFRTRWNINICKPDFFYSWNSL